MACFPHKQTIDCKQHGYCQMNRSMNRQVDQWRSKTTCNTARFKVKALPLEHKVQVELIHVYQSMYLQRCSASCVSTIIYAKQPGSCNTYKSQKQPIKCSSPQKEFGQDLSNLKWSSIFISVNTSWQQITGDSAHSSRDQPIQRNIYTSLKASWMQIQLCIIAFSLDRYIVTSHAPFSQLQIVQIQNLAFMRHLSR